MTLSMYKWQSPLDWLIEKSEGWTVELLRREFIAVASKLDSDQLQDLYENEMDDDGYFDELEGGL